MPYSKFDSSLEFNEKVWVVSLINTGSSLKDILGGHAKIVVEGVKRTGPGLSDIKLLVGEYHIMEAGKAKTETWVPQALSNTQCKYLVLISERDQYNERQEKQYAEVSARSHGDMKPQSVMRMIANIKQEKTKIDDGLKPKFQYAGQWCAYNYEGGHNCTTWAEEQLDIVGIGKHLITDSIKAAPSSHINSAGRCIIL